MSKGRKVGTKATKTAKKRGRPSDYSDKTASEICRRLAEGESLRKISKDTSMPAISTVMGWLFDGKHADFSEQYARARDLQADKLFDEALEIADETSDDWITTEDEKKVLDHEHVQRSRLRVDTRKWAAGKLAPKRYGDKLQHTGDGGGPIRVRPDLSKLTDEELDALERILGRATDT